MSVDNELPVKIVIVPPDSAQVSRALSDIEAKVAASGRRMGERFSQKLPTRHVEDYYKNYARIAKAQIKATIEYKKRASNYAKAINKQMTRAYEGEINRRIKADKMASTKLAKEMARQEAIRLRGIKAVHRAAQRNARIKEAQLKKETQALAKEMARQEALRKKAVFEASREGAYKAAGIKGPDQRISEIRAVRRAQKGLFADLKEGKISLFQYNTMLGDTRKKLNLLERGNVRARGALHKFTAQLASTTFELTGAFYGLTVLGATLSSPAIFGVRYLKQLEDTKLGISGILLAMGSVNGEMLTFAQASQVADEQINKLANDAISMAGTLEDFTKSYQAILAPGLAAGMTLDEIRKISVAGTVAVKTIGLDSRQIVQEIRDLVAGGIQAASSTLATSLGLTDRDIKAAKASSEGLFEFLYRQLDGFRQAGLYRSETLSGKIEQTWEVFIRGMAQASEPVFNSLKDLFDDILDRIASIDKVTNKLTFKKDFIDGVTQFVKGINAVLNALVYVVKLAWDFKEAIFALIAGKTVLSFWDLLSKGIKTYSAALKGAAAARTSLTIAESVGQQGFKRVPKVNSGIGILAAGALNTGIEDERLRNAKKSLGKSGILGIVKTAVSGIISIVGKAGIVGLALWGIYTAWGWWKDRIKSPLEDVKSASKKTKEDLISEAENTVLRIRNKVLQSEAELERARKTAASRKPLSPKLNEKTVEAITQAYKKQDVGITLLAKSTAEWRRKLEEAEDNLKNVRKEAVTLSDSIKRMNGALKDAKSALKEMNTAYGKGFAKGESESRLYDLLRNLDRAAKLTKELRAKAVGDPKELSRIDKVRAEQERAIKLIKTQLFYEEKRRSLELAIMQAPDARTKDLLKQELEILKAIVPLLGEEASIKENLAAIKGVQGEDAKAQREFLRLRLQTIAAYKQQAESLDLITPKEEKAVRTLKMARSVVMGYVLDLKNLTAEKQQEFDFAGKSSAEIDILKARIALSKKLKDIDMAYNKAQKDTYFTKMTAEQEKRKDIKLANDELEKYIRRMKELYDASRKATFGARQAVASYNEAANNNAEITKNVITITLNQVEDYLTQVFSGAKLKFKDFTEVILKELLRIQIAKMVAGIATSISGFGAPSAPSAPSGGGFTNIDALGGFASGGTFSREGQLAFANGGTFTNSIVSTPTQFKFARGTGLMGEAGPEAIMPLTRTSEGDLGVKVSGVASEQTNNQITVMVNVNPDGSSDTKTEGEVNMSALGKQLGQVVQSEIVKQQRPGGLLYKK